MRSWIKGVKASSGFRRLEWVSVFQQRYLVSLCDIQGVMAHWGFVIIRRQHVAHPEMRSVLGTMAVVHRTSCTVYNESIQLHHESESGALNIYTPPFRQFLNRDP